MAKILIVDDAESVRARYREILSSDEHEVIEAVDCNDALDLFDKENPDLVLMNNAQTPEMLREQNAEARIIMSSAMGQERRVIRGIRWGGPENATLTAMVDDSKG